MGIAMLPPTRFSGSGGSTGDEAAKYDPEPEEEDDEAEAESIMELELPGEEKKKRWEAKAEAKSGVVASSPSESDEKSSKASPDFAVVLAVVHSKVKS